ncbi:MAG: pantetheine-phosphate adenylyltransferase [Pseudomonadota bacterium]
MDKTKTAICAGTFDPPTMGHINIIERGLKIFDRLIVAVATAVSKDPIFEAAERVEILNEIFKNSDNVVIDSFNGLLVEYARKSGCNTILRGIRNMSDYEYESQMALANKTLAPEIETLYMMTEGHYAHLSSSIIKEIIICGGSTKGMIHPIVETRLKEKLQSRGKNASCK